MSRFVRASKFRHVFGEGTKKESCFDGIPITKSAHDSMFIDVNDKFVAICLQSGGGAFAVLKHDQVGRLDMNHPKVSGHKAPVLDVQWNPFNANMVASASEDCTVKVWLIPEEGITENTDTPAVTLEGHQKKVGHVMWHPTAADILFSSSADNSIKVWNVATGECVNTFECHPNTVFQMSFNWDGSRMVTTCKDKKVRIIDTHSGEVLHEADGHPGAKASRCAWLGKEDKVLTTGFSKYSDRQYKLFNGDLSIIKEENIDTSSGVIIPVYDADLNILYLGGKGDGNIDYYEINETKPFVHKLSSYTSSEPQKGFGFLPKRACAINKHEIARFYKMTSKNLVEPISMIVPRKSDQFQDDLYPDTKGDTSAITAEDWIAGGNADPILISLKDGFTPATKEFVAPVIAPKQEESNDSTSKIDYEAEFKRVEAENKALLEKVKELEEQLKNQTVSAGSN
ncbi:hypothetical protein SARC_04538 [Sphaeroforma arctica JP610]|uniref:Coronin n=1 Tax=Sphaeroforma arctica JP610 TaxID=667725 RepID=A0A0L0G4P7_9EUKA|nr:hypothetical protein SARC_04538 [Sphaeroforma arctica JP610]KNC83213.1 hypothetical protein SARC_04538 [Sphaeroforma arctica JP610]|eukprot:XP_014157115.1 hypothetical protein SARC_04538 [Sphaeroforma arctica JP610]